MFVQYCKNKQYLIVVLTLIAAVCAVLFAGCGGGGGGGSQPITLTQDQANQIEAASTAITNAITTNEENGSDSPLNDAVAVARQQQGVESATVSNDGLIVRYSAGGTEMWVHDDPEDQPPTDIPDVQTRTREIISSNQRIRQSIGNRNAVIINSFTYETERAVRLPYFESMKNLLEASGFTVTLYTEETCTPDILKDLQGNSLILLSGHGCLTGDPQNPYYTMAGRWKTSYIFTFDFLKGRIARLHNIDNRGDFFAVNSDFWSSAYATKSFNHGLFMNLECSGSAFESYRNALFQHGIDAYTGWSDAQGTAVYTAWRIIAYMVAGKTLRQAVDACPASSLHDNNADFWYGPDSNRDITLGGNNEWTVPDITISSPSSGTTIHSVSCTVTGTIWPWNTSCRATISTSVNTSALPVDDDGSFSQTVALNPGSNVIRVAAFMPSAGGSTATVNVIADIPSQLLATELSWNTDYNDLDLHLTPDYAEPFSTDDCYYYNKNPLWGGSLDFDDIDGFGPEHITADSLPDGRYRLWVDYFSQHGVTDAVAVSISVSTFGQNTRFFQLNTSRGFTTLHQIWNVCYLDFPSGAITPIDSLGTRSLGDHYTRPAKKK
ncbi:hypothetical protein LLG46_10445 [bacterium]|nr:hypothetical protein [bacterium]